MNSQFYVRSVASQLIRSTENMPRIISIILLLVSASLQARFIPSWDYDKLSKAADLVVIATPILVDETKTLEVVPGKSVEAPLTLTQFSVQTIMKGTVKKSFVLRHLRNPTHLSKEEMTVHFYVNGPHFVSFDPTKKTCYLMFLKRLPSGEYVSVTGQQDPAFGIKALAGYPGPKSSK